MGISLALFRVWGHLVHGASWGVALDTEFDEGIHSITLGSDEIGIKVYDEPA